MNRRDFLSAGATGAITLLCGCFRPSVSKAVQVPAPAKSPNVLFILCDDLNDSIQGMGGHPQAQTPNIDRLAKRGVRFTNAHANATLCAPSRISLWCGRYPSTTGYFVNRPTLRENTALWKERMMQEDFSGAGYNVHGTGKIMHYENFALYRRGDGFNGYGILPDHGPWPWDGQSMKRGQYTPTGHPSMPEGYMKLDSYAFRSFAPLSDIPNVPPDEEQDLPGYHGWTLNNRPFHYESEEERDLMPDELSVKWAAERLAEEDISPFLMIVGFMRPHTPMYAPKKYFDRYPLDTIQLPPYLDGDLEDCATILQDGMGRRYFNVLQEQGGVDLWKRWIQAYLACVTFVDDQVGALLDALDNSPHANDTIIVFTSDHGYHIGEKDQLFKLTLWEESTRIPLIIAAPGVTAPRGECRHPVSLIDLYPTLLDLCGLGQQQALDGHSLRPFLEDPNTQTWDGPDAALSCIHLRPPAVSGQRESGPHYSVRSKRWRYILCDNGEEELYDHFNDPHEWTNLADAPEYAELKSDLRRKLEKLRDRGAQHE